MQIAALSDTGTIRSSREIRSLTGVRGVAALYVIFYHYFQSAPSLNAFPYLLRGYLAVDLFFILSGLVMTMTYGSAVVDGKFDLKYYGAFLYKRLGRIYPIYFVVIFAYLIYLFLAKSSPPDWKEILANVLLVQTWGLYSLSVIGPGWSISTELAAYLFFPAIAYCVLKGKAFGVVLVALVASGLLAFVASRGHSDLDFLLRHGPLDVYDGNKVYPVMRCFAGFALGIVSLAISRSEWGAKVFSIPYASDLIIVLILIMLLFPRLDVFVVLMFVPFVISLSFEKSWVSRFFGGTIIYHSGLISYSLYILHIPLDAMLKRPLEALLTNFHVSKPGGAAKVIELVLLWGLASLSFRWIEQPARDAARAMTRRATLNLSGDRA